MKKTIYGFATICLVFAFILSANGSVSAAEKSNIFGLLLVGPYNDHGWSQAHFDGGKYVEKMMPGTKMIYIDKVNPADRPGVTIPQLVDDMVEKGARLIIANSDDMKDGTREAAAMHPDVYFIHISGDDVLTGKATKNLSKIILYKIQMVINCQMLSNHFSNNISYKARVVMEYFFMLFSIGYFY